MNKFTSFTILTLFFLITRVYSQTTHIEAENWSTMSGVQAVSTTDAGGGLCVGYIDLGDWMDYSVNIQTAGTYVVRFRVAAPGNGRQLQLKKSDGTILATVNLPNTGDYQTWQTTPDINVTLPAGQQTLRIYASASYWNFNWWELDPTNQPPTANAGTDQTITLPASSVTLNGSGSDPDGTISGYSWSQVSGPNSATIGSSSTASTSVSGLVQGTYVFRLTVTDNNGATGTDDVTVTVNASTSSGNGWLINGNSNTDPATQFIGTTDNQPLIFKTNNIQQAMLTTDGVFTSRKIRVTQSGWADYVFDSSYRLRPLNEVQNYIQQYKHLPDVPSAREVEKNGLDLSDNQTTLLKKIEELTMYVIELNKKVDRLSEENASLKKKVASIKRKK